MSAPEPEILSMEEVRVIAASRPGNGAWVQALCLTVEHWHREARGKASVGAGIEALKSAFESTVPRDTHAEVAAERDRLRIFLDSVLADLCSTQGLHEYLGGLHADRCAGCDLRRKVTKALDYPRGDLLTAAAAKEDPAAEQDRLRALVAGMREEVKRLLGVADVRLDHVQALVDQGASGDVVLWMDSSGRGVWLKEVLPTPALLSDPDGQRAYELAAKDREDAKKWRALMAEAEEHRQEPEHAAFVERAVAAIAEASKELRLLREIERTRPHSRPAGSSLIEYSKNHESAWKALAAFRDRQKGDPK